jgi:hypothetical protein
MPPRVLWSMAADQFIVDAAGKFSIIGVWETISAGNFPALHPLLFVVTAWTGGPNTTFVLETRIWTPTRNILATTGPQPFNLSSAGKGISINQFYSVQFPSPGGYRVEALANNVSAHHFDVAVQPLIGS